MSLSSDLPPEIAETLVSIRKDLDLLETMQKGLKAHVECIERRMSERR